jgi:hypothetical protein
MYARECSPFFTYPQTITTALKTAPTQAGEIGACAREVLADAGKPQSSGPLTTWSTVAGGASKLATVASAIVSIALAAARFGGSSQDQRPV